MIQSILKIFKALNSDVGPWQISFAAALGMVIGLTPVWSLHNAFVLLFAFLFRVHLATFFVFWLLFSAIAYLLDPWFHQLGLSLLNNDSLSTLWTAMYQSDFWQLMHFNHTITLGSFLVSIIAFVPFSIAMRLSIIRYRAQLLPWVNKIRLIQVLKGSRLFQLYQNIDS